MMTDTELKIHAFEVLNQHLGLVEMERFIALIQQEQFDYTHWRTTLFQGLDGQTISQLAMDYKKNQNTQIE